MSELTNAEDLKLVTLARGAMARIGASAGAAVRDQDGRTYSGAAVQLAHRSLSALELAVATAVASGARSLEAAVQVGGEQTEADIAIVRSMLQPQGIIAFCSVAGEPLLVIAE